MSNLVEKYYTITVPAQGLYKEKGSKFMSFAYQVQNEDEIKMKLDDLRKSHHDARHHCFAFMLGAQRNLFRANDDGEPNHSAGDPILGQINSKNLTNILIVVVRYFGGTKLGISGLINAYKTAAEDALKHTRVIEVELTYNIRIRYNYDDTNEVMRLVNDFDIKVRDQAFEADCLLFGEVKIGMLDNLQAKVNVLKDMGIALDMEQFYS